MDKFGINPVIWFVLCSLFLIVKILTELGSLSIIYDKLLLFSCKLNPSNLNIDKFGKQLKSPNSISRVGVLPFDNLISE